MVGGWAYSELGAVGVSSGYLKKGSVRVGSLGSKYTGLLS